MMPAWPRRRIEWSVCVTGESSMKIRTCPSESASREPSPIPGRNGLSLGRLMATEGVDLMVNETSGDISSSRSTRSVTGTLLRGLTFLLTIAIVIVGWRANVPGGMTAINAVAFLLTIVWALVGLVDRHDRESTAIAIFALSSPGRPGRPRRRRGPDRRPPGLDPPCQLRRCRPGGGDHRLPPCHGDLIPSSPGPARRPTPRNGTTWGRPGRVRALLWVQASPWPSITTLCPFGTAP